MAVAFTFRSPRRVRHSDLNNRKTLYGGRLLSWIDEDCFLYCIAQMQTSSIVMKYISPMDFLSPVREGDEIEIGVDTVKIGKASLTVRCLVRHRQSRKPIVSIDELVFVAVDETERPIAHARSFEKKAKSETIATEKIRAETVMQKAVSL